jgi:arylsulfatase A-like enzyme
LGITEVNGVLTLNNTVADADGLGAFDYQWQKMSNGAAEDIVNATSVSYTITAADIGYTISVQGSYIDGNNFSEVILSEQTAIVVEKSSDSSAGKPNILFIIADDQGLDASAQYTYSSDLPVTPTINALAEKGIVFDNVWATPACTTTRGALITGAHGVSSGISFVPAVMDSNTQTLQRYIKSLPESSDYQTAVIGKWHLGGGNPELSHPTDSGVDYYAGTITGTLDNYYNWELTEGGKNSTSTKYHTSKITDLAVDWLALKNQQQQPWFLWLAYVAPHSPFHLPPENLHTRSHLTGTDNDISENKREYYLAAIEAMDSEIGRLLDSLSAEERDNTLIVYIGDNGTPAGVIDANVYSKTHSKGSLYEGGIRVPMVVSGKGVSRINVRESALINSSDFYVTFSQFVGNSVTQLNDSYSFLNLLTQSGSGLREYNYSEFVSDEVTGWTVRDQRHKLIEFDDGSQQLYKLDNDLGEVDDLLLGSDDMSTIISGLSTQAKITRNEQSNSPIDITNTILINRSANCADYVENYQSSVLDVNNGELFNGDLSILLNNDKCIFKTNNIPNHDFNDGSQSFPNNVSSQNITFELTTTPIHATQNTELSLTVDNAILLNGVKVDLLAAACFDVGDGKVGCNDINQPWRYDPIFIANGFKVDTHNAHSQPDGSYHYHGRPHALYEHDSSNLVSPVVGFAADGYPIFGPYFDDSGVIRKAVSSFQLISGTRPSSSGNPGGSYDGTYRDDYQYQQGYGDLDECNGMSINGVYGYYITDGFPYVLSCFKGIPDPSFNK